MEWDLLEEWLEENKVGPWQAMAPMAAHTSWKIGGPARLMVWPESEEAIAAMVQYCGSRGFPVRILGAGSNLLVADEGVEALVAHTGMLRQLVWGGKASDCDGAAAGAGEGSGDSAVASVGAGLPLTQLAEAAARRGLAGLEFAAGIPGTFGGALIMNAGAYDGQIADVVASVRVIDERGRTRTIAKGDLAFGYRSSGLRGAGLTILGGDIHLGKGDPAQSLALMQTYLASRREKQPLDLPSGGSVFRNPAGDGAGRYIDRAGLKGLRIGDAQISEKHANFIVNLGAATARDVGQLMTIARDTVLEKYGVTLESEIVYWD